MYRFRSDELQVLLVHPGGPFFTKKNAGVWSIPKGEYDAQEDPLATAQREFQEETGHKVSGDFIELRKVKLKSGKVISAWAVEGELDADDIQSNLFPLEWPPRSGKMQQFPEVDRAGWFTLNEAREKIHPGQLPLLDDLIEKMERE